MKSTPAFLSAVWAGALGIVLLAVGCREKKTATPPLPANAVAVVGGQIITREQFQSELARRAQVAPGRFAEPGAKQSLLEELIRFEVLYQKALAAGYDKDPQVLANLKRLITAKYQEDQLARLGPPRVSPEDVAGYYQSHPQHFGTPEKVRAALIEIRVASTATAEKRAEAAARAQAVLAEARANASADGTFGLVAQRHSEHQSSRYRGGDIGWLTLGATNLVWPPAVTEAIFKLSQPGEIGPVIETPTTFYLIKLVERRPASLRPLAEVKDGVAYLVARQKEQQQQEELQAALRQGMDIRINQAALDSISAPPHQPTPPGGPVGPSARAASRAGQ